MSTKTRDQTSTDTKIELRICADPDYLCVARTAVRQVAQTIGLAEDDIEPITLAVEEALTNVIRHSYGGPCDEPVVVKLSKISDPEKKTEAMEILVRDFGRQVDPENIKGRDLDDIKPGGLGVHIIQSVMDEIEFTPAEDKGMRLRMVKYID